MRYAHAAPSAVAEFLNTKISVNGEQNPNNKVRKEIASPPFLILATPNGDTIDCSPKDDAPGFVQLLDDRTLLIPDRPGNNRIDDPQA